MPNYLWTWPQSVPSMFGWCMALWYMSSLIRNIFSCLVMKLQYGCLMLRHTYITLLISAKQLWHPSQKVKIRQITNHGLPQKMVLETASWQFQQTSLYPITNENPLNYKRIAAIKKMSKDPWVCCWIRRLEILMELSTPYLFQNHHHDSNMIDTLLFFIQHSVSGFTWTKKAQDESVLSLII